MTDKVLAAAEAAFEALDPTAWAGGDQGGVAAYLEYDPETGTGEIKFIVLGNRLTRDGVPGKVDVNFLGVVCAKLARLLANLDLLRTTDVDQSEVRVGEAPWGGALKISPHWMIWVGFSGGPPNEVDIPIAEMMARTFFEPG